MQQHLARLRSCAVQAGLRAERVWILLAAARRRTVSSFLLLLITAAAGALLLRWCDMVQSHGGCSIQIRLPAIIAAGGCSSGPLCSTQRPLHQLLQLCHQLNSSIRPVRPQSCCCCIAPVDCLEFLQQGPAPPCWVLPWALDGTVGGRQRHLPLLLLLKLCWQLGRCRLRLLLVLLLLLLLLLSTVLARLYAVDLGPLLLPRSLLLLLLLAWRLCVNHYQPTWLPCWAALLTHASCRLRVKLLPCLLQVSTASTC